MSSDRRALANFLRARRDRISPSQAGIAPMPGPRRVPGLRREELAYLAGVSTDYYSRVEQGRQANISVDVLESLARALRLHRDERAHLLDLASSSTSTTVVVHEPTQSPDPGLRRIMNCLDHLPVSLLGQRGDVLARNALLAAVLDTPMPVGSSFTRYLFENSNARSRIVNWEVFAQASIAALRGEAGRRPHDARLNELICDLRAAHLDVERWWNDHRVRDYTSMHKHIRHPAAGDLHFDIEIVTAPHDPEQRLVIYTAEPNSNTVEALRFLTAWSSEDDCSISSR
jgi:transcriptional regulator with XRE-family HTH domain